MMHYSTKKKKSIQYIFQNRSNELMVHSRELKMHYFIVKKYMESQHSAQQINCIKFNELLLILLIEKGNQFRTFFKTDQINQWPTISPPQKGQLVQYIFQNWSNLSVMNIFYC